MAYVITEGCLDIMDRSCLNQCPVDCIQQGGRMLYINPDDCIDCGACESVCPQGAIFFDEELPADRERFRDINAGVFALGLEPGADHPVVRGLPG
ncbi:4Fe-4S binding protein [Amycolatopsis sp. K13G38]|uniref:Ferredoxin n=1 Tax=Amycolatopsis acididurans TaxID=2724524 RepID=A0ABX1JDP6_9PSEU|nr:ferredoxin family protein [Amycolatopsis acididurans]NKQ57915.1 4Fe-4S binding protein [Amycolatopsis acididurans]